MRAKIGWLAAVMVFLGLGAFPDLDRHQQLLDSLPKFSVEAFCGVANLWNWATVTPQADVLDLGCGARPGYHPGSQDGPHRLCHRLQPSMLERNRRAVAEAGLTPKVIHGQADAQRLPLEDQTLDVTLINGIFNLNADPQRQQIFSEVARVSRPGGIILAAEIILKAPHKMPPDPSPGPGCGRPRHQILESASTSPEQWLVGSVCSGRVLLP